MHQGGHGGHTHYHFDRAFAFGIGLNTVYILAEVIGAWAADSMALLADAGHNFSDVLSLILAWFATRLARRLPSPTHTYGYGRSTILAALLNGLLLLVAVGGIIWESVHRCFYPEPVAALTVMSVASVGILINGVTAWLFAQGRHGDLNIRGAFLHMLADAAISAGVVVSGFLIYQTNWNLFDPLISIAIAVAITWSTVSLLIESLGLAMDAVPRAINLEKVAEFLRQQPGVVQVHDLHVWAMATDTNALTVHIVRNSMDDHDNFLGRIMAGLRQHFRLEHVTIQVESDKQNTECHPCEGHNR